MPELIAIGFIILLFFLVIDFYQRFSVKQQRKLKTAFISIIDKESAQKEKLQNELEDKNKILELKKKIAEKEQAITEEEKRISLEKKKQSFLKPKGEAD